jgi:hypothetical protein
MPALTGQEILHRRGKIGPAVDTFGVTGGESKARLFEVYGYAFLGRKPK